MKYAKITFYTFFFSLILGLFSANAQMREVTIENSGLLNCIRDAIVADLEATDSATVSNTKYLLERDETYIHSEQYEAGHAIWLEAAPGDGARPRILPISLTTDEAPRLLRVSGNTTFISLRYEGLDSEGNHTDNAPLRQRGNGTRMHAKDVLFPDHRHEVGRVDGGHQNWLVEDCIFARNYRKPTWYFGYTYSFRNQNNDSLIFRNNTYFNATGCLMHSDNQGGAKYFEFTNSTIYSIGGLMVDFIYNGQFESALINAGPSQNVKIMDNLIIDSFVWGYNPIWADSISIYNVDMTDSTENIEIGYNNFYRDPKWDEIIPDTLEVIKVYDGELAELNDSSPFPGMISEAVTFNNVPSQDELVAALELYIESPSNTETTVVELATTPADEDVDFGYSGSQSATGSSTGGPLGDPRWYGTINALDDEVSSVAKTFKLHGNYPNPFNPTTTISFDLPATANVQIAVMNTLGQIVYQTPFKSYQAGSNLTAMVDGSGLSSGVYFYQVLAEFANSQTVKTGKMVLLK